MPEQTVLDLNYLWTELIKVGMILQRPVVQIQFLGVAVSILLGWLVRKMIWAQLTRRFPTLSHYELSELKLSWQQVNAALVNYLLSPTFILIMIGLLKIGFEEWGWFAGYLGQWFNLVIYVWFYRLLLVSLYALYPANSVSRYRQSFFAPLFYLFLIGKILSWFLNLQELSQVNLIKLFARGVTLGSVFIFIAGLYFLIVGIPLLEKLLLKVFFVENIQDPRIKEVIFILLRYSLMGLGIALIFGYVGFSPTALAAITGGLSVGIGFGLKEVISNFVSGVWLLFEGALKTGDTIIVEGKMSIVKKLGIRATTVLVDMDHSEEIIPNQIFFTQNISTYTGSNTLIKRSVFVGASYKCSPLKVIELLLQVAHQNPQVLKDPSPKAFVIGFGDSSIDFELKFWLDDPLSYKSVTSQLSCDIWQAFADNNIEIPYPQRDLHIRNDGNSSG